MKYLIYYGFINTREKVKSMTAKDLFNNHEDITDPRHKKNHQFTISAKAENGELYTDLDHGQWKASMEAIYQHKNTKIVFEMGEKSMTATIQGSWEW
ncbi:hypothetical protein GSN00_01295 [Cylindrospermopsis raciborskii CHAB3438]|nr:hypothetical protein [Cylindrospermopsis raciborskii CHAB3438]